MRHFLPEVRGDVGTMGFGRGILEEPRRTVALLAGVGPFGEVVSPWGTSATVVTPAGTPPFRPPEPHAAPVFPHEADPHGVVPRVGEPQPGAVPFERRLNG